jgi:hypothetical protein
MGEDQIEQFTLESIAPPAKPPQRRADPKTKEELDHQKIMHELERTSFGQDIQGRKTYARCIFWLIVGWLLAMFLLLIFCGIQRVTVVIGGSKYFIDVSGKFQLSDKVLVTLIGGTTANVLGLFAIVCNYLFPKQPPKPKKKPIPN